MKLAKRERGGLAPFRGGGTASNVLDRIRNEINRVFEEPFNVLAPSTTLFEGWEPTIDVYEDNDKVTVKAELPGTKPEDIQVSLEGDTLTISGERKYEEEKKEGELYRSERFFGRFQRSITLPSRADPGKIQATYKDGVLTVVCPKSEESKARQIQVKTS